MQKVAHVPFSTPEVNARRELASAVNVAWLQLQKRVRQVVSPGHFRHVMDPVWEGARLRN